MRVKNESEKLFFARVLQRMQLTSKNNIWKCQISKQLSAFKKFRNIKGLFKYNAKNADPPGTRITTSVPQFTETSIIRRTLEAVR